MGKLFQFDLIFQCSICFFIKQTKIQKGVNKYIFPTITYEGTEIFESVPLQSISVSGSGTSVFLQQV